jgi:hypothetical protein
MLAGRLKPVVPFLFSERLLLMFTKKLVVVIVCVLALTAWAETASALELITNGGFETGDFTNWRALGISGAAPTITSTPADVHEGSFAAVLTKTAASDYILLDNFSTEGVVIPGQILHLSYAAKQLAGDSNSLLEVAIKTYTDTYGEPTAPFNIVPAWTATTPDSSGYTTYSYDYTVTGGAKRLYFAWRMPDTSPVVGTYAIDAVSANVVGTVPEKITNGGFETGDFTNWRALGLNGGATPTITTTPADVHEGTHAAVLTKTATSDFVIVDNFGTEGPVVPGQKLRLTYSAKQLVGDSNSRLEVAIKTYTDTYGPPSEPSEIVPAWTATVPGSSYTTYNFDYTVPDGASKLYFAFRMPTDGPVGTYAIDAVSAIEMVALPGDYNQNGIVDAADFVVWRKTLGQTGLIPGSGADGNANGMIDSGDYDFWRSHFGNVPGSGSGATVSAAVPEPTTIAFVPMAFGVLALSFVRCRERRHENDNR